MKFLLGHKYQAYRAYVVPNFTESHKESIASNVARYIYLKYTSTTSDLIPRYLSAEDVMVAVNADRLTVDGLEVAYLTIDHAVTQVVAFFRQENHITVLIDLPLPVFLVQMLESLDFETPLILKAMPITNQTIHTAINSLRSLVEAEPSMLGELSLTFVPQVKLTNDSLREIIVSVPRNDSKVLVLNTESGPLLAILAWLEKTTTLKLQNMNIKSVDCDLLSITSGGKIAIKPDDTLADSTVGELFSEICKLF